VFVSGTTGFDYTTMTIADSIEAQTAQCLKNIASALERANASLRDVVRVTYALPNGADFPRCWPILREYFGDVRPAAMMILAGARRSAHADRDRSHGPEAGHDVSRESMAQQRSSYAYTAKVDAKAYPVPNWGTASVTLKRVDASTIERTLNGSEIGTERATWTLSSDRKTLTVNAKGTDASGSPTPARRCTRNSRLFLR
jgi:hypothetical protein